MKIYKYLENDFRYDHPNNRKGIFIVFSDYEDKISFAGKVVYDKDKENNYLKDYNNKWLKEFFIEINVKELSTEIQLEILKNL